MFDYEKLPQWRKEIYNRRVQKILNSKTRMSEFPESFWRQVRFDISMLAIGGIANIVEHYENQPLIAGMRALMGKRGGEIETPSSIKKIASDALIEAAALGNTKTCEAMLGEGLEANINAQDSEKRTALYHAIRRKRLGTASYLLDHGARVDIPNEHVLPPVLKACHDGCMPVLNMFKHHKIDFNRGYELIERGKTRFSRPTKTILYPLEAAFFGKQAKVVRFLLDNGADVNIFNPYAGIYTVHQMAKEADFSDFLDPETKGILMQKLRENPVPPVEPLPQQNPSLMQRARVFFQR